MFTSSTAQARPVANQEVILTSIAGPLDSIDALVSGGGWSDGTLQLRLYAIMGSVRGLVATAPFAGPRATRVFWTPVVIAPLHAVGNSYELAVFATPHQNAGFGVHPSAIPFLSATLTGANGTDAQIPATTSASAALPANSDEVTVVTGSGYHDRADVAVELVGIPAIEVRLYASCGANSVEVLVASQPTGGPDDVPVVMAGVALPVCTSFRVAVAKLVHDASSPIVTASLGLYNQPANGGTSTTFGRSAPNIATLPTLSGTQGSSVFVDTTLAPWIYTTNSSLPVDHITVEVTADGGATQWVRTPYSHPLWQAQISWSLDPVDGNDENSGLVGFPIKTLAELMRRVADPCGKWTSTHDADIFFLSYPPATDPLRLDLKMVQPAVGVGPRLTFHPPAYTQASTGTFTAVQQHVQGTNTPWMVTDGVVVTTGDVRRRIRISGGARTGASTWVALSTGAGQRRTGTWATWGTSPTPVVPVIGDPYVVEFSSAQLAIDFIHVELSAVGPFGISIGDQCILTFDGLDFTPVVANATVGIRNAGAGVYFTSCAFAKGEWSVRTIAIAGDSMAAFTVFQNCATYEGFDNLIFLDGSFIENFVWAGVFGGAIWTREGAGVVVDFDVLGQSGFSGAGGVPGFFTNGGNMAMAAGGIMDQHANDPAVVISDGVVGVSGSFSLSGNVALWGTSANAGTWGVDARAGGTLRYQASAHLTITGVVADTKLAGSTTARAWDEAGGVYTAALTASWANIVGGTLKDNAHSLTENAHIYLNAAGGSQAQP